MLKVAFISLGLLSFAVHSAPTLKWDAPVPSDERITRYELHCAAAPATFVLDGSQVIASVESSMATFELSDELAAGSVYECVATSLSTTHGLRSGPSNSVALDLSALPSPTGLRVTLSITVTVE